MKIQLRPLVPSSLELTGALFVTIVILLLANSRQLLNYYGLQSSNEFIKSDAGNSLNHALKALDSFSATNGVITFLIWAVVGVLCFSLVEAMSNAYRQVRLDRQVSSARYIHPASFNAATFWRGVVLDMSSLIFGLALLLVVCLVCLLLAVPLGEAYTRVFLFDVTVQNALYVLLGLVVVFGAGLLLDMTIRFLLYRRKVIRLS